MKVRNYGQPVDLQASAEAGAGEHGRTPVAPLVPDVALFLDVDGTVLDIADHPGGVTIPVGLIDVLGRIERKLSGALALISGRRIEDIDRLFFPLRLRASGVHGAEMRFDPEGEPRTSPRARQLPEALVDALTRALQPFPGVFVERKTYSVAVHYRGAPQAESAVRDILHRVVDSELRGYVEIFAAHFAFELKFPGFDKGEAVGLFMEMEPFSGRAPIFVGDDTTDEAGFAAVVARGGHAYCVGGRRAGASGGFDDPPAVRAWLAAFAT
jgi:trehalose 6-phosphate phosphatase